MNTAATDYDGENKYIRITDIDEYTHQYINTNKVSPLVKPDDKYLVKEKDILFARTGASVGKSYHYSHDDGRLYFAGFLIRVNIDKANSYFIFNQTLSAKYEKWVNTISMRSGQPGINAEEYKSLPISLTGIQEQEKIASFMSLVDKRIQKQEQLVELLKKYKRGFIEYVISKENTTSYSLSEITKIYDGTHQTPNYKPSGIKFVSVENIEDLQNTEKFISYESYEKEFRIKPEMGDVLMTRIGDIGTATYIDFNEPMAFYVSLALFKCSNLLDGRFLSYYICTNRFQKELWKRTLHIAFPKKINTGEIGDCKIDLPEIEKQKELCNISDNICLKLKQEQLKLAKLIEIKKGLLQQLFI